MEIIPRSFKDASWCLLCGGPSSRAWCSHCHQDMLPHGPECQHCAIPLPESGLCGTCLNRPPRYACCRTLYQYSYPVRDLIVQYKYRSQDALGKTFASYFIDKYYNKINDLRGALIPVPLHWKRQCLRGFNQSTNFARCIASTLNVPCLVNVIRRNRNTRPQTSLEASSRRKNIRNAFEIVANLEFQNIVLVDDVTTTGITTNEICRVLKQHGVKNIELWVIARAHFPSDFKP